MNQITAEDVAEYLQQHPEFFHDHINLLEQLSIPHPSGVAVSLIAKQLEIVRNKQRDQEQQLAELIEIARKNDASFYKLHQLTLKLLAADTLPEVIANLEGLLKTYFNSDFLAIRLIHSAPSPDIAMLFIEPNSEEMRPFLKELGSQQIRCARPTLAQAKVLFGDFALEVNSCAIIPMTLGQISGLLAIGSREQGRFHYSMGQLFLAQIGELVSARLWSLLR